MQTQEDTLKNSSNQQPSRVLVVYNSDCGADCEVRSAAAVWCPSFTGEYCTAYCSPEKKMELKIWDMVSAECELLLSPL